MPAKTKHLDSACNCSKLGNCLFGKRFSYWKVIKFSYIDKSRNKNWLCRCKCGKEKSVRGADLLNGKSKCCGCMGNGLKDEKHPNWKGDKVGYEALHDWVRVRILKPKKCECCKSSSPYDLANISQKYKRDLTDWEYLCRACHMKKDGRIKNLRQYNEKK